MSEAKMEQFNEEVITSFRNEVIKNLSYFKIIDSEIDTDTSCDYKKYYDKHLGDKLKSTFLAFKNTNDRQQEQKHANAFRVYLQLISRDKMSYQFLDQLFIELKYDQLLTKLILESHSHDNVISRAVQYANMETLKGLHNNLKQIIVNDANERADIHAYLFEAMKMTGYEDVKSTKQVRCFAYLMEMMIDLAVVMDDSNNDKSLLNKKFSNEIDESCTNGTPLATIFNSTMKFMIAIEKRYLAALLFAILKIRLTEKEFETIEDCQVTSIANEPRRITISPEQVELVRNIVKKNMMPSEPPQQINPEPKTKTQYTIKDLRQLLSIDDGISLLSSLDFPAKLLPKFHVMIKKLLSADPESKPDIQNHLYQALVNTLRSNDFQDNENNIRKLVYIVDLIALNASIKNANIQDESYSNKEIVVVTPESVYGKAFPILELYAKLCKELFDQYHSDNVCFFHGCLEQRLTTADFAEFSKQLQKLTSVKLTSINTQTNEVEVTYQIAPWFLNAFSKMDKFTNEFELVKQIPPLTNEVRFEEVTENRMQPIEKVVLDQAPAAPEQAPAAPEQAPAAPEQAPAAPEQAPVEPEQTSVEHTPHPAAPTPAKEIQFDSAFHNSLNALVEKVTAFATLYNTTGEQKYEDAYKAVLILHNTLYNAGKIYFSLPPTKINHGIFKLQCEGAISTARNTLDNFRDCKKIIANILGLLALPLYLIAMAFDYKKHGRVTFFSTDSSVKISAVEDAINGFQPR